MDIDDLLDRLGALRHPCDLDLLLFFARHPRALLTSDQLATRLGYEPKRIADSLDLLLASGLLTRSQNPTHAARMYVFDLIGPGSEGLRSLLAYAATRAGRLAIKAALTRRMPAGTGPSAGSGRHTANPRPLVVRSQSPRDLRMQSELGHQRAGGRS